MSGLKGFKKLVSDAVARKSGRINAPLGPQPAGEAYAEANRVIQEETSEALKAYLASLSDKERDRLILEVDEYGWSLFHSACAAGKLESAYALLQAGWDVHAQTKDSTTGLHYLAKLNAEAMQPLPVFKQLLAVLVSKGARLNQAKRSGETALHVACTHGNDVAISFLLGAGCNLNAVTGNGDVPLHYAVHSNQPLIVATLLEAGAAFDVPNVKGQTPAQLAEALGLEAVTRAFVVNEARLSRAQRHASDASSSETQIDIDVLVTQASPPDEEGDVVQTSPPLRVEGCWEAFRREYFGKRILAYYLDERDLTTIAIISSRSLNGVYPGLVVHQQGMDRFEVEADNLKLYEDEELPLQLKNYLNTDMELARMGTIQGSKTPSAVNLAWQPFTYPTISADLLCLEARLTAPRRICVGVSYGKEDQNLEAEFFQNRGSKSFEKFLGLLGERIVVGQWDGWAGTFREGDDTQVAYYSCWRGFEFIFHVATLLDAGRQRQHIGNDTVLLFWKEGELPKAQFRGQVNSVAIVCQPLKVDAKRCLSISTYHRARIPRFRPMLPGAPLRVTDPQVRNYIFTNIVNGTRAALRSGPYANNNRKLFGAAMQEMIEKEKNR